MAPRAMLVAPPGSDEVLDAAREHFMNAGFADVSIASGTMSPPPNTPQPAVKDRRIASSDRRMTSPA
jgi:hypothetical protein